MENTLFMIMALIGADEVVHIIDEVYAKTLFFGTIRNAYAELDEKTLKTKKVLSIYTGFGGLCISTVDID